MSEVTKLFEQRIGEWLTQERKKDATFDKKVAESKKDVEGCCNYILSEVRKAKQCGYDDDEIYGMARLVGASGTSQLTSGATTGTVTGTADTTTGAVTGTSAGSVTNTSGTASTMADMPVTFGHNIPELDENGKPVGGYDDYFGAVCLGYEFEGDADKIKAIWKSTFALYMSAKLFTFEGSTQIG